MPSARELRVALVPAGLALGLFAEWAALRRGPFEFVTGADRRLAVGDLIVGFALIACGLVVWSRRSDSRIGVLLVAAGFAWFLGTFAASEAGPYAAFGSLFVTLHRGPLVHAILSYPRGRVSGWLEGAVVGVGYAEALIEPLGTNEAAAIALSLTMVAVATRRYLNSTGPEHRAHKVALSAALGFGVALVVSNGLRLAGASPGIQRAALWGYLVVVLGIAVGFTLDLLFGRWTQAAVTQLVVDLGDLAGRGVLRDRLANALGDRSLVVGFWLPEEGRYVDETGGPIEIPGARSGRHVTLVEEHGEPIAVLIHDPAVLGDQDLLDSVAAATRIAVSNVRLQLEIRRQVQELVASRRRIVQAGDVQRRKIERELRQGAEQRLAAVRALLGDSCFEAKSDSRFAAMLTETRQEIERAQEEVREFARGVHPRVLTERGLPAALAELVRRAPVPVELRAADERYPAALEAAVYFVCSEALANIGKYAKASRAEIDATQRDRRVVVVVHDDGIGGARLDAGSGLRGLADRVEALGGRLSLDSPPGRGTLIVAELPLT